MSEERITDATDLNVGDVVTVATELRDKRGPGTFWWTRFAVVASPAVSERFASLLSLKLQVDLDKDLRFVDVTTDIVHRLPENRWPQGVVAMRMKHIHLGNIDLSSAV